MTRQTFRQSVITKSGLKAPSHQTAQSSALRLSKLNRNLFREEDFLFKPLIKVCWIYKNKKKNECMKS